MRTLTIRGTILLVSDIQAVVRDLNYLEVFLRHREQPLRLLCFNDDEALAADRAIVGAIEKP